MAVKNNRPKFWNMVSVDDTCGEIILYGDIERRTPIDWFTGMPLEENVITPQGFLDDLEKNIETARAMRMKGIVFQSYEQASEELNRLIEQA